MTDFTESDFDEFALADEGEVLIKDPFGLPMLFKGKQVSASVFVPASKEWAKVMHEIERETTKELTGLALGGTEISDEIVAESTTKNSKEMVIKLTKSLNNFPYPGGKEAVLRANKFSHIYKQIHDYLNRLGNFYGVKKPA